MFTQNRPGRCRDLGGGRIGRPGNQGGSHRIEYDTHSDLILRVAAAGKATFCEKPVDLTVERARACAMAVKEAGVLCMIGFQRRYDPTFSALKERILGV